MYIPKYLISLTLSTISILSFAQNSNEPKLTQQAYICLSASNVLEFIVDYGNVTGRNSDKKLAYDTITKSNLPLAQQYRLHGMVALLYAKTSLSELSNSPKILNSKQIAIEYYLSCMSDR